MAKKELPSLEWFSGRINALEEMNSGRNEMFEGIDKAIHQDKVKEEQFDDVDWIHHQTSPRFAIVDEAASRILADPKPEIRLTPYSPDKADRDIADAHEKALGWLLKKASQRRKATIVEDAGRSSHRYSETAAEVIFLPEQIKNIKAAGGNPRRYEAAIRDGEFVVEFHNPRNVHARYSSLGVEEVGLIEEQDPHNVVDLWGKAAEELKEHLKNKDSVWHSQKTVLYKRYYSWDWTAAYVEHKGGQRIELSREEWLWPFLPWACKVGGTSLEAEPEYERSPLLGTAWRSGLYETLSKLRTMQFSDALRWFASPRRWFQSDYREQPTMDARSPDLMLKINEDEKMGALPPNLPDPAMQTIDREFQSDLEMGTLSSILLGGDIPSGAAYSSINLVTHSALGVIKRPRRLAQDTIAEICKIMLLWLHYTQTNITGYEQDRDGFSNEYLIKWKDIQPDNIYIEVELKADVPADRGARATTAVGLVQSGIYSKQDAREEMGAQNAKEIEDRIHEERWFEAEMELDIENERYMRSKQAQDEMRAMIIQEIEKREESRRLAAGPEEPNLGPGRDPNMQEGRVGEGIVGAEDLGEMINPRQSSVVPQELAPGETREVVTGKTAGGEDLAAV